MGGKDNGTERAEMTKHAGFTGYSLRICTERFRASALGYIILLVLLAAFFPETSVRRSLAQETGKPGKSAPVYTHVDWAGETGFQFQEMELAEVLQMLSESNRFAYLLDRRVDTETPVTYTAKAEPLAGALAGMAEAHGLDAVFFPVGEAGFAPVVYFAPSGTGGELLLALEMHRAGRKDEGEALRNALGRRYKFPKEPFAAPSDILKDAAKKSGISWSGTIGKMPFDYWRTESLPPIAAGDLFTIVLFGFNVDYRASGEKPTLVPVPLKRDVAVSRSWNAEDLVDVNQGAWPEIEWTAVRKDVRGTGPFGDVAKIEMAASKSRMKRFLETERLRRIAEGGEGTSGRGESARHGSGRGGVMTISGEVRQVQLRDLIERLETELDIKVVLDPSLDAKGITPETRISCRFDDTPAKDAVKTVADKLGATVRIKGKVATIFAK